MRRLFLAVSILGVGGIVTGWIMVSRKKSSSHAPALSLPREERLGQRLFLFGTDGRQDVLARLEGSDVEMRGGPVACAKCHGKTGKGSEEGGIVAPDIRVKRLREHFVLSPHTQDWDDIALRTVITQGFRRDGSRLHQVMPRYELPDDQWNALLSYLKRQGDEPVPGVSPDRIRIGLLLGGPEDRKVDERLRSTFAEWNSRAGIYRRTIELLTSSDATAIDPEMIFLLIRTGRSSPGDDPTLPILSLEETGPSEGSRDGFRYALFPGAFGEGMAAAAYVYAEFSPEVALVVDQTKMSSGEWIAGASKEAQRRGFAPPRVCSLQDSSPEKLGHCISEAKVLLLFADVSKLQSLLAQRKPGQIFAVSGHDFETAGSLLSFLKENEGTCATHPLTLSASAADGTQETWQWKWDALTRLLEKLLRQNGVDLNRLAFIESMEALRGFEAAPSVRLTFGSHRSLGLQGSHVICNEHGVLTSDSSRTWVPIVDW